MSKKNKICFVCIFFIFILFESCFLHETMGANWGNYTHKKVFKILNLIPLTKENTEGSMYIICDNSISLLRLQKNLKENGKIALTPFQFSELNKDFSKILKILFEKNDFFTEGIQLFKNDDIKNIISRKELKNKLLYIKKKYNTEYALIIKLYDLASNRIVKDNLLGRKKYVQFHLKFYFELIDLNNKCIMSSGKILYNKQSVKKITKEEKKKFKDSDEIDELVMKSISNFFYIFFNKLFLTKKSADFYYPVLENLTARDLRDIFRKYFYNTKYCDSELNFVINAETVPDDIQIKNLRR